MTLPPFCLNFSPWYAFSMVRPKHHCNEACGLTVSVNGPCDASLGCYRPKVEKWYNPLILPQKQKWGSMHFQWEYDWLNV